MLGDRPSLRQASHAGSSRVEDGREAGRRLAACHELGRLVDGERVGASKLGEEQVVLNEVVTKRRFGERTVCQPVRKGDARCRPATPRILLSLALEETHDLLAGSASHEVALAPYQ